jgi:hypothetical protein
MYNFNDIVLQVAMFKMGGEAGFVSTKSRLQYYKYSNLRFESFGLRFPIDSPYSIELSNNKIVSRFLLESNGIPLVPYTLIETNNPVIPSSNNLWVLKIPNGMKGKGIVLKISTNQIPKMLESFKSICKYLFLEPYIYGDVYRVLVLEKQIQMIYSTSLPKIFGDGKLEVRELFNNYYKRIQQVHGIIHIADFENEIAIKSQGLNWNTIIKTNDFFYPTFICNISRGAKWKIENQTLELQDMVKGIRPSNPILPH